MTKASMRRLLTATYGTKRLPALSAGKRGSPAAYLAGVSGTEFIPTNPELAATVVFDQAHDLLTVFVEGTQDVVDGDVLVAGGKDYPIRAVARMKYRRLDMLRLLVEDTKS